MIAAGLAALLIAPVAVSQAQPAADPPPAIVPELWRHLLGWEAVMTGATSFVSNDGTRTETDAKTGASRAFGASVWCLRPNMTRLRLHRLPPPGQKADPDDFTTYIGNGRALYEYDGAAKTVTEYPPPAAGGAGDHLLLALLGGSLTARQVADRLGVQWVSPADPNYLILELTPRLPKDRQEFDRMTLVLVRPDLPPPLGRHAYLPRQVRVVKPNAQATETWDFPTPLVNAAKPDGQPIGPRDFEFVAPDKGWKVVKAAKAGANPDRR